MPSKPFSASSPPIPSIDAEHLVADRLVGLGIGGDLQRERQHGRVAPLAERPRRQERPLLLAARHLTLEVFHGDRTAQRPERLVEELGVVLVLGLDLRRAGDEAPGAAVARRFVAHLGQELGGLPVGLIGSGQHLDQHRGRVGTDGGQHLFERVLPLPHLARLDLRLENRQDRRVDPLLVFRQRHEAQRKQRVPVGEGLLGRRILHRDLVGRLERLGDLRAIVGGGAAQDGVDLVGASEIDQGDRRLGAQLRRDRMIRERVVQPLRPLLGRLPERDVLRRRAARTGEREDRERPQRLARARERSATQPRRRTGHRADVTTAHCDRQGIAALEAFG